MTSMTQYENFKICFFKEKTSKKYSIGHNECLKK